MKKAATVVMLGFVAFFVLIASTFYGMNGNIKASQNEDKSVTKLTFINSWGGYDSKATCLDGLLDDFNDENPNIEVANKSMAGDDFLPYIKEQFKLGTQPDVFGLWPGSDIRALIAAGKVADITSLLMQDEDWKNSFDKNTWSLVKQNDKIYGIPVEMIYEGLYINKSLFRKYGAVIPHDYDDLKADVKIFKQNGIIPIAFNCTPEGSYLYQNIAMSLGGKSLESPFENGKIIPSYIDGMYILRELFDMGAFPPENECFSMDSNARDDLFLNEKAAMIVQGSWFTAKCKDKNVDMIAFPKMSPKSTNNVVYGLGCGAFYISQKSYSDPAKKTACVKLLKYLSSKESSVTLAQQTDMISNVDISSYNIPYDDLTLTAKKVVAAADTLVGPPDSYIKRSVWESIVVENFPNMLKRNISPEDLWKQAMEAGADKDR